MSGAEGIATLGVISSTIQIIYRAKEKQVYNATTGANGLPEAFHKVAGRLPIAMNILSGVKQCIKER
jgi:N-terminal domain on NACHT_NTPase and P-loop NTPases